MNAHPGLLGLSAMLFLGGFFAWPIAQSRLAETERKVIRHENEIDNLQHRVAQLEGNASNLTSFEATNLRRELVLLRERVEILSKRDGRSERDGQTTKPPVPAPATPPR